MCVCLTLRFYFIVKETLINKVVPFGLLSEDTT